MEIQVLTQHTAMAWDLQVISMRSWLWQQRLVVEPTGKRVLLTTLCSSGSLQTPRSFGPWPCFLTRFNLLLDHPLRSSHPLLWSPKAKLARHSWPLWLRSLRISDIDHSLWYYTLLDKNWSFVPCLSPCRLLRCRARWPVIRNSKTLSSRAKSWSNAVRFRRCSNGFGCFFDGGFRVWFVSHFFCVYILWWLWCVVILWEMHCAWRFLFAKSLSDASAYLRFNLGHYEVLVSQESRSLHRHVYIGADIAGIALLHVLKNT